MKPAQEVKLLRGVLRRMDARGKSVPERWWFLPPVWVLLVACLVVVFQMIDREMLSLPFLILIAMLLGGALCYAVVLQRGLRQWPALTPHVNRGSVESRVAELSSAGGS